MTYQTLLYEIENHVATITLNRPKLLNALSAKVFDELEEIFTDTDADPNVRVILITGAGEKAFAAGADINELAIANAATGEQMAARGQAVFSLIESCGRPVIALINGFALGGGCELAMACTMRLASDRAKLGQPEVKLGIIPGYAGPSGSLALSDDRVRCACCLPARSSMRRKPFASDLSTRSFPPLT